MRPVLFRGKILKAKDKWIESNAVFTCPHNAQLFDFEKKQWVDVDAETVEQWTNLLDVNDKPIFEGDVLSGTDGEKVIKGVVIYNGDKCAFQVFSFGKEGMLDLGNDIMQWVVIGHAVKFGDETDENGKYAGEDVSDLTDEAVDRLLRAILGDKKQKKARKSK